MRKTPCRWLGYDATGRPWCEHGPARRKKPYWRCRLASQQAAARYQRSDKGRVARRIQNARPSAKSSKAVYELGRVRFGLPNY